MFFWPMSPGSGSELCGEAVWPPDSACWPRELTAQLRGNFSAHSTKQTAEEGRLPRGSADKGPKEQRREERLPSLERQNSSRNEGILPCADSEEDLT